jgi:hypothetical protein
MLTGSAHHGANMATVEFLEQEGAPQAALIDSLFQVHVDA